LLGILAVRLTVIGKIFVGIIGAVVFSVSSVDVHAATLGKKLHLSRGASPTLDVGAAVTSVCKPLFDAARRLGQYANVSWPWLADAAVDVVIGGGLCCVIWSIVANGMTRKPAAEADEVPEAEAHKAEAEAEPEAGAERVAELVAALEMEVEAELEAEAQEAEVESVAEAEPDTETEAEPVAEAEPEAPEAGVDVLAAEPDAEAEAEPDAEAEAGVEVLAAEPDAEAESVAEVEAEPVAEAEPDAEGEAEPDAEVEAEPESEPEAEPESEPEAMRAFQAGSGILDKSESESESESEGVNAPDVPSPEQEARPTHMVFGSRQRKNEAARQRQATQNASRTIRRAIYEKGKRLKKATGNKQNKQNKQKRIQSDDDF
jgi:hypothetical protein